MDRFIFGRVPRCARVGLLRTTLTLGASHCLTACFIALTQTVF
ncbi:MAG: hypothetical protein NZ455_15790 [Bacteroidia bacterium]|nr:hypothetical protein [Bacteroidia bacterium]